MTYGLIEIAKGLNSNLRLLILKLLCESDMNSQEIFLRLRGKVKYRQYIHRNLEILRKVGIINKYYNVDNSKLYYHLNKKRLIINFDKLSFEFFNE